MNITSESTIKDNPGFVKQAETSTSIDTLHHLAFDNAVLATIITAVRTGQIVSVNKAACKLFGYSKKAFLEKNRSAIFDVKDQNFKKVLQQKTEEHSVVVKAIRKNGLVFSCEVSASIFTNEVGFENAIFSITDLRESILKQKLIDKKKEKISHKIRPIC